MTTTDSRVIDLMKKKQRNSKFYPKVFKVYYIARNYKSKMCD